MTVLRLARRGIRASFVRLLLTIIAIAVGVGFVSGSLIISDSLDKTFSSIFEEAAEGVDARIRVTEVDFGYVAVELPASLVDSVAALPEVGGATPAVTLEGSSPFVVLDDNGDEVRPNGPPIITFSWNGEVAGGVTLAEGRPPSAIGETAINRGYADLFDASVGNSYTFNTPNGRMDFEIVGIVEFEVSGGAAFVLFDFESAQELYDKQGLVDVIALSRAPGVSATDMIAAVAEVLPPGAEVLDQEQVIVEDSAQFETIIGVLRAVLLAFAGIALFVSLFIVYNTFAILVTQRMQQIGMLGAIGASARQIRAWLLLEALVVGVIAAAIGLVAGFGIAVLIQGAFQATGGFPETETVLRMRTVWVSIAVGVVATLISALIPAVHAARLSPIAAMRQVGTPSGVARGRVIVGAVLVAVGVILLAVGLTRPSGDLSTAGPAIGLGSVLIFIGVFLVSALFAGRVVDFLGRPWVLGSALIVLGLGLVASLFVFGGTPDPIAAADGDDPSLTAVASWVSFFIKLLIGIPAVFWGVAILAAKMGVRGRFVGSAGRIEGHLARRNAARSPIRTAATATALTIGITLVSTVSVVAESLKAGIANTVSGSVVADLFVYNDQAGEPFSEALAGELASIDGVDAMSQFRFNEIRVDGEDVVPVLGFASSTQDSIVDFGLVGGSLDELAHGGVMLLSADASDRSISVGDVVPVEFPTVTTGNAAANLTVVGLYDKSPFGGSQWVIDLNTYNTYLDADEDAYVGLSVADSADADAVKADVVEVTSTFASIATQDNREFIEAQEGQIDGVVTLINYLLGFALFVAFVGVVNTIVLSVVERTREIGLLRAVGASQRQVRAAVRWEAVIVCMYGALVGIALGLLFGWAAVTAIPDSTVGSLAVPWESLVLTLLVAAIAGVAAAGVPAFLAARRNVLEAIASP